MKSSKIHSIALSILHKCKHGIHFIIELFFEIITGEKNRRENSIFSTHHHCRHCCLSYLFLIFVDDKKKKRRPVIFPLFLFIVNRHFQNLRQCSNLFSNNDQIASNSSPLFHMPFSRQFRVEIGQLHRLY